ncbi:MAG TPA: hypothetical protein VII28_01385 [Puia sp.]
MKYVMVSSLMLYFLISCQQPTANRQPMNPLIGTWQLISGTTIQGKDTVTTTYTGNKRFLKIINGTHFSFVGHDLTKGKDSLAFYSSGAGTYTLTDSNYTEHLQFCSDRVWEGNDFSFHIVVSNDSLTQTGIEKIEKINVNRLNIERYVRVKE